MQVEVPRAAHQYRFGRLFINSHRLGNIAYVGNQSLYGTLLRLLGGAAAAQPYWVAAAAVVGTAGLLLAAWASCRGQEMVGILTCALAGLLISPVSWSHHWVWVAPTLVVLADFAVHPGLAARVAALAVGRRAGRGGGGGRERVRAGRGSRPVRNRRPARLRAARAPGRRGCAGHGGEPAQPELEEIPPGIVGAFDAHRPRSLFGHQPHGEQADTGCQSARNANAGQARKKGRLLAGLEQFSRVISVTVQHHPPA